MILRVELVRDFKSELKHYPIGEMKAGNWAVVVGFINEDENYNSCYFGYPVTCLQSHDYRIYLEHGKTGVGHRNYLVRDLVEGERVELTEVPDDQV